MRGSEQLAAAALLASIAWTAWDTRPADTGAAALPTRTPPPVMAVDDEPDEQRAITERSLFAADRRGAFDGAPVDIGGLVLRGIVAGPGGAVAVFEQADGGPGRRLRVGGVIGGYRVAAIEEASVVLERAGRRRRLAIDQIGPVEPVSLRGPVDATMPPATSTSPDREVLPVIHTRDEEAE